MLRYGQFCPVAKTAEILGERWTLLVLRELLMGSRRYADLQRGLGRISPSVLSQRLKTLTDAGIIKKRRVAGGYCYEPTVAGRELTPLIEVAGSWGQRWARSKMTKDEQDVDLLMVDIQRNFDAQVFPERSVVRFHFTDLRGEEKRWWLLLVDGAVEVCVHPPGQAPTVSFESTLKTMQQIWMGDIPLDQAISDGRLRLDAPAKYRKTWKQWFKLSTLANVTLAVR